MTVTPRCLVSVANTVCPPFSKRKMGSRILPSKGECFEKDCPVHNLAAVCEQSHGHFPREPEITQAVLAESQ